MKIELEPAEKKYVQDQLFHLAIRAAEHEDRELHRQLVRLAEKFTPENVYSEVRQYEAEMIVDFCSQMVQQFITDTIPKVEKSEKPEEEKTQALQKANDIVIHLNSVVGKLKAKLPA